MNDRNKLKRNAVHLRNEGKSYGEISKKIKVSKSTLSYWLKDIPVTNAMKKRFYTNRIRNLSIGAQSNRERRKKEIKTLIETAIKEIETPLDKTAYTLFGAALYWAEGTKKGMFEFTNSDPLMVFFMVRWIENVLKVPPEQLTAKLNMYKQQKETDLKLFWSDLCKIPLRNFGKSYIKPTSKNVKKGVLYYGTIKIIIPKSTDTRLRVFGWIEGVMQEYSNEVKHVQRKWEKLETIARPINLS